MRSLPLLAAVLLAPFCTLPLVAHPDHSVTQKGVITPVPSDSTAPGRSEVTIVVEGNRRTITANGLPDHATGRFPNRDNPHAIAAQRYRYTVPAKPAAAPAPIALRRQPFGIALNGVLFDPGTAEAWQDNRDSGWSYEAKGGAFSLGLDTNNAHVQPNGAYHYHGLPVALLARLSGGKPALTLVGWAADGFPIYGQWGYRDAADATSPIVALKSSYRLKSGMRPTEHGQPGGTYDGVFVEDYDYVAGSGDLDQCSGRFGITPEFPAGTYYYVLTEDFPFIPRYFHGVPDPSFAVRRGEAGPGGRRERRPGPPPAQP